MCASSTSPPVHARAVLNDVSNLTERVIGDLSTGQYEDAIFAGEYIQRYYPVRVILKSPRQTVSRVFLGTAFRRPSPCAYQYPLSMKHI